LKRLSLTIPFQSFNILYAKHIEGYLKQGKAEEGLKNGGFL
jgi:hypothetical protein